MDRLITVDRHVCAECGPDGTVHLIRVGGSHIAHISDKEAGALRDDLDAALGTARPKRNARIDLTQASTGSFVLGGVDISNEIGGFRLTARVGHLTELELQLVPHDIGLSADVVIEGELRQALLALGWTPPGTEGRE